MENNNNKETNRNDENNKKEDTYTSMYSNINNNLNIGSNSSFGNPISDHTNKNKFFDDSNTGTSGNLVGPDSDIFKKGFNNNNNNSNNFIGNDYDKFGVPKFGGNNSGIKYDPIGPLGWGEGNNEIPDPEKFAFPDIYGLNDKNKKKNIHPDLLHPGFKNEFNSKKNDNNFGSGFGGFSGGLP